MLSEASGIHIQTCGRALALRALLLILLAATTIPVWAADRASRNEVRSRPVASAGPALSARILVPVTLDGSARHDAQAAARGGQGGPIAFAWALVQPDGNLRSQIVMSALMVIARQDPLRALEAATSLPSSHERDVAMSMTVDQWAGQDVRAALA